VGADLHHPQHHKTRQGRLRAPISNPHAVQTLSGRAPSNGNWNGGRSGNSFLKGTKIRTTEGERKIEDLAACDLLPTKLGGLRAGQSIGRYPYTKSHPSKPWAELADSHRPLSSRPNVPHADLYATAAHSLLIDDVLVPAELLINGTTITRFEPEAITLNLPCQARKPQCDLCGRGAGRDAVECRGIRSQFRRVFPPVRNADARGNSLCSGHSN
jgi:hypothetical protein